MIIIGAGLSGLIAANMLRGEELESVFEAESNLPNNHSALLRFRSSVVGDAVGIPFRKVKVMKTVSSWRNPVADALSYSIKCTGSATLRSSISASSEIEDRYIAPADLTQRLYDQLPRNKFAFGQKLDAQSPSLRHSHSIISTIPMPALMKLLGWKTEQQFNSMPGYTLSVDIPEWMGVNACVTVYVPDPTLPMYRVSLTERRLIIEMANAKPGDYAKERLIGDALQLLGIDLWVSLAKLVPDAVEKPMRYAKILPIDERERKNFIMWASDQFGIFSLGRFATWRPGLLLDDIVNDVRTIQKMANGDMAPSYAAKKAV